MKLTNKHKMFIGIGILAIVVIYSNRGNLFVNKAKLDANSDGDNAIDKAISKLKSGQVAVNEMPENVRKELSREV